MTTNLMQKYSGSPACKRRGSFAPLLSCVVFTIFTLAEKYIEDKKTLLSRIFKSKKLRITDNLKKIISKKFKIGLESHKQMTSLLY